MLHYNTNTKNYSTNDPLGTRESFSKSDSKSVFYSFRNSIDSSLSPKKSSGTSKSKTSSMPDLILSTIALIRIFTKIFNHHSKSNSERMTTKVSVFVDINEDHSLSLLHAFPDLRLFHRINLEKTT